MAVTLPTDIVMDVARAASPEGVEMARAELARKTSVAQAAVANGATMTNRPDNKDSYVKFESMVLGNFMQSMMPKENDAVFGKGLSGDMWQQLMAQELGKVIAERGGIGIADRMLRDHYVEGEKAVPVGPMGVDNGNGQKDLLSTAIVQEIQRRLTQSITEDWGSGNAKS